MTKQEVTTEQDASPAEKAVTCTTGVCPGCERVVFSSVNEDSPERRKDLAREVAKLIRAGIRIENWSVESVRAGKWMCQCKKSQ